MNAASASASGAVIRPYESRDRGDVYEICVLTGAGGTDATGLYSNDELIPDVYAGPYVEFEPELAFVVDTGERAAGYVLGVVDTQAFVERYRREWIPRFEAAHPVAAEGEVSAGEARVTAAGRNPDRMLIPELHEYPAHLHIDLLPQIQGSGLGRRLIETLCAALRDRGVPGVHLQVDPANTGAVAFYARIGFTPLLSDAGAGSLLGLRL
jgi:ribosomal protein S18 acetylase RimI-like enzyme